MSRYVRMRYMGVQEQLDILLVEEIAGWLFGFLPTTTAKKCRPFGPAALLMKAACRSSRQEQEGPAP